MGAWRMASRGTLAAMALLAPPAAADDPPATDRTPVRLEFTAPPGCPDAADFARRVAERAPHLRRAADGGPARIFRGSVRGGVSGVVARLVLVEPDGRSSERTLDATDCQQATDALALITALAVEQPSEPPAMAPEAAAPAPVPTPSEALPAPVTSNPSGPPAAAVAAPPRVIQPPASRAGRESPVRGAFDAIVGVMGALGLAPGPTAGGQVEIGGRLEGVPALGSPSLRVGVGATLERSFSGSGGTATFRWLAGLGEACPFGLAIAQSGILSTCVAGEYGVLHGRGSNTAQPHTVDRPWAAAGLAVRYSTRVLGPARAEVILEALAAIDRSRFLLGSDPVYEVPPACGRLVIGVGF
jgi:hypothetical protein